LISQSDTVVLSAYRVAEWTQDAAYFQSALVSISSNLARGEEGEDVHKAQEELLDIAEVLVEEEDIQIRQYIALVDAILTQNDMVVAAYDGAYAADDVVNELLDNLKHVADLLEPVDQTPIDGNEADDNKPEAKLTAVAVIAFAADALIRENKITNEAKVRNGTTS